MRYLRVDFDCLGHPKPSFVKHSLLSDLLITLKRSLQPKLLLLVHILTDDNIIPINELVFP